MPPSPVTSRRGPRRRPSRWPSPVQAVLDPSLSEAESRSLSPRSRSTSTGPPRRLGSALAADIRRFRLSSSSPSARSRSAGSWESFSGGSLGSFGSFGGRSVSASRSSTQEMAYERAVATAAAHAILAMRGADAATVSDHQRQLERLDAERATLPVDVRTRPDWRAPHGARIRGFEVFGSAPWLMQRAFWKALAKHVEGQDVHPACVRLGVVSAGMDPEGALQRLSSPVRTYRSERREAAGPGGKLPLTGRQEVTLVHAEDLRLPEVVGGPGDRYAPDPKLRAWLAGVTEKGYRTELNPRRRRKVRGMGRRYLFRVMQGSNEKLWNPIMRRLVADAGLPIGRERGWAAIYPEQLRAVKSRETPQLVERLRGLLTRLVRDPQSPAVGMVAVRAHTRLTSHALAFVARAEPARRAFYGPWGLRVRITLLNPNANSELPTKAILDRMHRAGESAARAANLLAPSSARPADIRRGALGHVLVGRLGPAVRFDVCRVQARRAVQQREPSCGPSSFALMLAAARLGVPRDCSRIYRAVGDEDVVLAAQLYRQA